MRCNNCGWQNQKGKTRCEKCNYPLDGSLNISSSEPEDQPQNSPESRSNDPVSEDMSNTIQGSRSFLDPWDAPNSGEANAPVDQNSPGSDDYDLPVPPLTGSPGKVGNKHQMTGQSPLSEPEVSESPYSKTFDPSRISKKTKKTLRLKLVAKEGEDLDRELEFTEEQIDLNREKVDPDNYSITSKVQASIEFVDGSWYIIDKSELKTTFVQVNEPYKLKPGDIILLGNRKIIFEE
jgi:hypothetical protein